MAAYQWMSGLIDGIPSRRPSTCHPVCLPMARGMCRQHHLLRTKEDGIGRAQSLGRQSGRCSRPSGLSPVSTPLYRQLQMTAMRNNSSAEGPRIEELVSTRVQCQRGRRRGNRGRGSQEPEPDQIPPAFACACGSGLRWCQRCK